MQIMKQNLSQIVFFFVVFFAIWGLFGKPLGGVWEVFGGGWVPVGALGRLLDRLGCLWVPCGDPNAANGANIANMYNNDRKHNQFYLLQSHTYFHGIINILLCVIRNEFLRKTYTGHNESSSSSIRRQNYKFSR